MVLVKGCFLVGVMGGNLIHLVPCFLLRGRARVPVRRFIWVCERFDRTRTCALYMWKCGSFGGFSIWYRRLAHPYRGGGMYRREWSWGASEDLFDLLIQISGWSQGRKLDHR